MCGNTNETAAVHPLLSVQNLKTFFYTQGKEIRAVDGVNFSVLPGQILCIVGESGCGKSITALSIMGLVPKPQGRIIEGEIYFEGRNLLSLGDYDIADLRGNRLSMIFQEPMTSLNPVLRIGDQITEVLLRHRKISTEKANELAAKSLYAVGIPKPEAALRNYPHELSGGMRQRVMIAMATICEPALLIADEPTTALDVTIQAQVLILLRRLRDSSGMAIIFITHDFGVVAEIADQVAVMYAGRVLEYTDADTIFNSPLHPYTRALLDSIPRVDEVRETLYSIPGSMPDASNPVLGCRFFDRCEFSHSGCLLAEPKLSDVSKNSTVHLVRCSLIKV
jgi:oligopeptide/dipeptide ABC transporter ATP-binding protein